MHTGREELNTIKEVSNNESLIKNSNLGKIDNMNFSNLKSDQSCENDAEDFFKLKESSNSRDSQQIMSNEGGRSINNPLIEESPRSIHYGNMSNLLISPTLERACPTTMTPQRNYFYHQEYPEYLLATSPAFNFDMRIHSSPITDNITMLDGLKHDERSSSFRRILNFNTGELASRNHYDSGNFMNQEYFNRSMTQNYYNNQAFINQNQNLHNSNNNITRINDQRRHNKSPTNMYKSLIKKNSISELTLDMNFISENEESYNDEVNGKLEQKLKTPINKEKRNFTPRTEPKTEENLNANNYLRVLQAPQGTASHNKSKKKICCTCTKSQCLKKYCECFANDIPCRGCECLNCLNTEQHFSLRRKSLDFTGSSFLKESSLDEESQINSEDVGCNCTKSGCMKKYCECFKAERGCKETCRCINCENRKIDPTKSKRRENNFAIYPKSAETIEKFRAARNPQNFIIEGTSVYIRNEDISITQRKETPQSINRNLLTFFSSENTFKKNIFQVNSSNLNSNQNLSENHICVNGNESKINVNENNILNLNLFVNNQSVSNSVNSTKSSNSNHQSTSTKSKSTELYSNETPKIINKKRNRLESKDESLALSSSTHFQTPFFTTSQKRKLNKGKQLVIDEKIVKNLDKEF